ncbi:MAG: site-specific integrase [Lachnospiraceae bacterium]|nr:site-specific integrase [Lachnospiraceae bacterium]
MKEKCGLSPPSLKKCEELYKMLIETVQTDMERRNYLNEHKYSVYTDKHGKWITTLPADNKEGRRIVRRNTREELERVITDYYREHEETGITLSELYPKWLELKRDETASKPKTLQRYISDYNTFLKGSNLSETRIKDITPVMLIKFFRNVTKYRSYTSKRITALKGLLSGILSYAVETGIITHNPALEVNIRGLPYKQEQIRYKQVYRESDVRKLLLHLRKVKDIYAYAIRLMFNLFCRIGELKALKWSDFDFEGRTVFIHAQVLESQEWTQEGLLPRKCTYSGQTKGNTSRGARYQYLTDETLEILNDLRKDMTSEFVFTVNGHFLLTNIFNRHLKRYCEEVGIPYYSSHKIRFYNASVSYTGDNLTELQILMGHSESSTTLHYLRNVHKTDLSQNFTRLGLQGSTDVEESEKDGNPSD